MMIKATDAPATRRPTNPTLGTVCKTIFPTMGHVPNITCTAIRAKCGAADEVLTRRAIICLDLLMRSFRTTGTKKIGLRPDLGLKRYRNGVLLAQKQVKRVFEYLLECLQELRSGGAVDHAMIAGHGDAHRLTNDDLAVVHDRLWRHGADGQDCALRRINHRSELVDAEHSEVADRETGARIFFGLQLARAGARRQFTNFAGDFKQALQICR